MRYLVPSTDPNDRPPGHLPIDKVLEGAWKVVEVDGRIRDLVEVSASRLALSTSCSAQTLDPVEVRSCVNRGQHTSVAVLTGLTSAPLITMPLVYLFRPSRARLEPQVTVGRGGASLALRGQF